MGADWRRLVALLVLLAGCNQTVSPRGQQFTLPLAIEGRTDGHALVDTGAEGELILAQAYGLDVIGSVPVILFSGATQAPVTEPFAYTLAGVTMSSPGAIIRESNCACDAVGTAFFRRSGLCVRLDYRRGTAVLVDEIPRGGIEVPLTPSVGGAGAFDSARVTIRINETSFADAILDTGANVTAMRRSLVPTNAADGRYLLLSHHLLGSISVPQERVLMYDTPGLPDLIIGTDVMPAWGNVWYFTFGVSGGRAAAFRDSADPEPADNGPALTRVLQSAMRN
jgi:hypothetical protein